MGETVDLRALEAEHRGEITADRHAVTHGGDGAARVSCGELREHLAHARLRCGKRLAALHVPARGIVVEILHLLRRLVFHVAPRAALPDAERDLAQARRGLQRQLRVRPQDRLRGVLRALQIAGIHRVERHIAEPLGERVDLLAAARRDLTVPVALDAAVEIALRLGMADEIDRGHGYLRKVWSVECGVRNEE